MQQFAQAAYMPAEMAADRGERAYLEILAKRLYILAWVIEGIAVALGLGMALSLNVSRESTFADFLLGGGGFVMVACAELSKIPLATFFVETQRRRAKLATLAFLLLMSFITFETIFMSLERGFNARLQEVHHQKEQIENLNLEHKRLSKLVDNPGEDLQAARTALEKQLGEIDRASRSELDAIRQERSDLLKQGVQSNLPKEIEQQLSAVDTRRKLLTEERDRKLEDAEERARKAKEFWSRERSFARKNGDAEREQEASRKLNVINARAERSRIENEYQRKFAEIEGDLKRLTDKRAESVEAGEAAIKPRLDELAQNEKRISADYGRKRDDIRTQLADVHVKERSALETVKGHSDQRNILTKQIRSEEWALRKVAAESQLHRIATPFAKWWTGEHYEPHTIPDNYVKSVAVVWFGSMAMLGALGGAGVAMVSQLLRKRADGSDQRPQTSPELTAARRKFWTSLRRMLVSRKFRRVRKETVEVVKVETQTKIVAVPVPTHGSFHDFKREYAELSQSLPLVPSIETTTLKTEEPTDAQARDR